MTGFPAKEQIKTYFGADGLPLNLGTIYFGQPGLNPEGNPIAVYWDAALSIPAAQPLRTANGKITREGQPANVFLAGDFSSTVYDSRGQLIYTQPNNVDFLSLGSVAAGSVTVVDTGGYYTGADAETVLQEVGASLASLATGNLPTGAMIDYVGSSVTAAPTGFVYASGETIGNVASNATERNNADTSALYTLLWNNYSNTELPIQDSGGTPVTPRNATAADDFNANRRLPLPDLRGRVRAGMGKMGKSGTGHSTTDAGLITVAGGNFDGTIMGKSGGAQNVALSTANLAVHSHTITVTNPSHTHNITDTGHTHANVLNNPTHAHAIPKHTAGGFNPGLALGDAAGGNVDTTAVQAGVTISNANTATGISLVSATQASTATAANSGSGTAHANVQPTQICTVLIKL